MKIRNLERHSRSRRHKRHMARAKLHLELMLYLAENDAPVELLNIIVDHTGRDHLDKCGCPVDSWPAVAVDLISKGYIGKIGGGPWAS